MSFFKPKSGATASTAPRLVPWVEKYRPESLDDVSSQEHAVSVLKRTLNSNNLPHMLFYGPPGTGKTSTILALAKELFGPELMKSRVLELNASDERGISIVREKVKNFARISVSTPSAAARKQYPCPPYKLVILDEADSMTQDAQAALRRTMETYSRITRFCLICNYVTRIIDPVASRCSKFRFKPLDSQDAVARLTSICAAERMQCEDGVVDAVLRAADGDLRKAITLLQSAAKLHGCVSSEDAMDDSSTVTVASIDDISGRVPENVVRTLIDACASGLAAFDRLQKVVEDVVLDGWSAAQVVLQIHDALVFNDDYSAAQKNEIVAAISETDKRLLDGANEHLSLLDLVTNIANSLKIN